MLYGPSRSNSYGPNSLRSDPAQEVKMPYIKCECWILKKNKIYFLLYFFNKYFKKLLLYVILKTHF